MTRAFIRRMFLGISAVPLLFAMGSCSSLEGLAELPNVDFYIDRVTGANLAGVSVDDVNRVEDLGTADYLAIAEAVRRGSLPLRFNLHVGADNAAPYEYDLRLEKLEWTLLLEDRDTVSGIYDGDAVIGAAGTTDIPVPVDVDLLRFFDEGASDLVRLALRLTGIGGGDPANVKLRARPTFRTPLGSYRFPNEITITDRDV
jgi:hypothetical protein